MKTKKNATLMKLPKILSSLESLLPSIELLNEEAFASQKEVITEENKRHGPDDDTQNPK
jgi:hypothetical protein